jgi:putative holliday junction resolvase
MKKSALGIDLGTKTLGLAYSDKLGIVHPLTTFRFASSDYKSATTYVIELCKQKGITDIALGYPLHMSGLPSKQSIAAENFKQGLLEIEKSLTITLIDERLTTIYADKLMKEINVGKARRKEIIDSTSAVIILQTYLQGQKP